MNLLKSIITTALVHASYAGFSQYYIPSKPENITEQAYASGKQILISSYEQAKNLPYVAADYWNFAVAYYKMGQSKDSVYAFLEKSSLTERASFCEIVNMYHEKKEGINNTGMFQLIGDPYKLLVSGCETITSAPLMSAEEYARQQNLSEALILQLHQLQQADQRYRTPKYIPGEQSKLDSINLIQAEQLLTQHGYVGRSLAGQRYEHVLWMIIQHSNLNSQEKYLAMIHAAVQAGELSEAPLKMLLDRIYTQKTGKQIFGSQLNVPFADQSVIESVKERYLTK
jgi:hypothetical protein